MTAMVNGKRDGTGWGAVFIEMLSGVRAAVIRFPVPAIFFAAAALQANLIIADIRLPADEGPGGFVAADIALGLWGAALAALAASLAGEARGAAPAARHAAAMVAALVTVLLVALSDQFLVLQWTFLAALCGLVLVAPFLGRGGNGSFWMFSARTAFATLLGLLALLLLAGGISAILASLTYLFGFAVPDVLYQHVWTFTSLFAAPLFALGQFPDRFDEQPGVAAKSFMDRGMRALGDFLAAPLLIIYALILHIYALKIVIGGEMPEGQIGWLVLTYGFCLFAALLIINPFFDHARAPTRLFLRFWPFFLPVPLVLLFFALAERVQGFGFTPDRYLLGLFGAVTAVVVLLQFLPRCRGDIRLILAFPVFALILGSFGPQGALGVSISSQAERFLGIVRNPPVEGKRHEEALGALSFLSGRDALARVMPEGEQIDTSVGRGYEAVARAWGLDPNRRVADGGAVMFSFRSDPAILRIAGYDLMADPVFLNVDNDKPVTMQLGSGGEISFSLTADSLLVTSSGETVRFPVADAVAKLMPLSSDKPIELSLEAEGRRLLALPRHLYLKSENPPVLGNLDGTMMLRASDWR